MIEIQLKLFVQEFFNTESNEIVKDGFTSYDLMQNAHNETFLKSCFGNPPTILPIQNLGEIAFILQKPKEAMALLDISLKLYKKIDPDNILKFKNLALLGAILEQQGQQQITVQMYQTIFKQLDEYPDDQCYLKVFAKRNYGFLLAKDEATRLEGNDYIQQAEQLQKLYPQWSERKLNLFVPVLTVDEQSLLL